MNYSEGPYEALWLTMIGFAKKTLHCVIQCTVLTRNSETEFPLLLQH